jgi:hypothetical protein
MANLIDKLQKLIAHEKSAREIGNIAEAQAFAAKIANLLSEHNLNMSDVEVKEQERSEPIGIETVDLFQRATRVKWIEWLGVAIAETCFCRTLVVGSKQLFVGRTSDRQAAAQMFRYLANAGMALADRETLEAAKRNPVESFDRFSAARKAVWTQKFRKSYLLGFATAIYTRLKKEREDLKQQSGGCALIVRKDTAVVQFMATIKTHKGGKLRTKADHEDGYARGFAAGSGIGLAVRQALAA